MKTLKVLFNETDVTEWVVNMPDISISSGEVGQLIYNDFFDFEMDNINGEFDYFSPNSLFYLNANLNNILVKIIFAGTLFFEGRIHNLSHDYENRKTKIQCKTVLNLLLERTCTYASPEGGETPADAIRNICEKYLIPFDPQGLNYANSIYGNVAGGDKINISVISVSGASKIIEIFQSICDIGMGKIFEVSGKLFFEIREEENNEKIMAEFSHDYVDGCNILGHAKIESIDKEKIEGYKIEYVSQRNPINPQTSTASRGLEVDQTKVVSAGEDSPVRILDLQTAVWVGEAWYYYSRKEEFRVVFNVETNYFFSLRLGSVIRLALPNKVAFRMQIVSMKYVNEIITELEGSILWYE